MRRARDLARRAAQTAEERDARLRQIRDNRRQSLATESEEERAVRLQQMRDRLASETEEERAARLQRMSANQCHRLPSETEEERVARLQRMSANQCHRLATETEEERAVRLQQMSANQYHRLAAETGSERPDYSVTEKGKEDNSHSCLCLNSPLFRLRCGSFCTRLCIHRIRAHTHPHNALHSPSNDNDNI